MQNRVLELKTMAYNCIKAKSNEWGNDVGMCMQYIHQAIAPTVWYAVAFQYVSQLLRKFPIKCVQPTYVAYGTYFVVVCVHSSLR